MRKDEQAHFGQKIRTESSPDRSSHRVENPVIGPKCGGGPMDVSHSISGTSVEDYNDKRSGKRASTY